MLERPALRSLPVILLVVSYRGRTALFYLGALVVALFILFEGSLLLISPTRFLRFGIWVGRVSGTRPPEFEWKHGLYLGWRFAGLCITAFGAFIAWGTIRHLLDILNGTAGKPPSISSSPVESRPNLFLLSVGLVMFIMGVVLFLKPQALSRWRGAFMPYLVVRDQSSPKRIFLTRMFGILWMLGGIAAILFWVRAPK